MLYKNKTILKRKLVNQKINKIKNISIPDFQFKKDKSKTEKNNITAIKIIKKIQSINNF